MTTRPEGDRQAVLIVWGGVGLVLDGRLVKAVSANSARVGAYVPRPAER